MWIIPLCSTSHSKCGHLETFWVAVSQRLCSSNSHFGLPWWLRQLSVCLQCGRPGFDPCIRKIPWRRKWQPTPVLLPGESHGWKTLVGYNPWGRKELDTAERLHFTSLQTKMRVEKIRRLKPECYKQMRGGM